MPPPIQETRSRPCHLHLEVDVAEGPAEGVHEILDLDRRGEGRNVNDILDGRVGGGNKIKHEGGAENALLPVSSITLISNQGWQATQTWRFWKSSICQIQ